jgi:outer membrane lipoprotein-sorting protein
MLAWVSASALIAASAGDVVAKDTAQPSHQPSPLSAEQIVEKNVAARGGLELWRKIDAMVWVGHMESADPTVPRLTFVLEQKRPNKTRFELSEIGQKTLRVFDGKHGWKVKPNRDGSLNAQPYSPQDLQFARGAQGIDGPLIDYKAKGISVESAGVEKIEGRKAYRLHLKGTSGEIHDVWIDAKTFLDVKYDRTSYRANGEPGIVSVVYRNYKTVEGLQIPSVLEIGGGSSSSQATARMVIEKIALNPPLDDKVFAKPNEARRRRMATVDIEPPAVDPRQAFGPMGAPGIAGPRPDSSPQ